MDLNSGFCFAGCWVEEKMLLFALAVAIGLKLFGIADVSWVTVGLVFAVWLQRGKDWMDIDNAIRRANGRIDEMESIKSELERKQDNHPTHDKWDD